FMFYSLADVPYYVILKGLEFRNVNGASVSTGNADNVKLGGQDVPRWASYVAILNTITRDSMQGIGGARQHHIIVQGNQTYNTFRSHTHYIAEQTEHYVFDNNYDDTGAYFAFHAFGHLGDYPTRDHHMYDFIIRRNTTVNVCGPMIITGSEDIKR